MLSDSSLTNILTVSGVSQIRYRAYCQQSSRTELVNYLTNEPSQCDKTITLLKAYKDLIDLNIPTLWRVSSESAEPGNSLLLELWVFWFDERHTGKIDANDDLYALEEIKVGSFTWENAYSKIQSPTASPVPSSTQTNSSIPVTVSEEYKWFIKAIRNLIQAQMKSKGAIPLGEFYIFTNHNQNAIEDSKPDLFSSLNLNHSVLCCSYNIYLASTSLILQPNTRRMRLSPINLQTIQTRGKKVIISPSGETVQIASSKNYILPLQVEESILKKWSILLDIPYHHLIQHSAFTASQKNKQSQSAKKMLPNLVAVRRLTGGEPFFYPTSLIFVSTSSKISPTAMAGMNGLFGYNRGYSEDLGDKWSRWTWNQRVPNFWEYTCSQETITSAVLDSLAQDNNGSIVANGNLLQRSIIEPVVASPLMATKSVATPGSASGGNPPRKEISTPSSSSNYNDDDLNSTDPHTFSSPQQDQQYHRHKNRYQSEMSLIDFAMSNFAIPDTMEDLVEYPIINSNNAKNNGIIHDNNHGVLQQQQQPLQSLQPFTGLQNHQVHTGLHMDQAQPQQLLHVNETASNSGYQSPQMPNLELDAFGIVNSLNVSNMVLDLPNRWDNDGMDDLDNFDFGVTEADFDFFESSGPMTNNMMSEDNMMMHDDLVETFEVAPELFNEDEQKAVLMALDEKPEEFVLDTEMEQDMSLTPLEVGMAQHDPFNQHQLFEESPEEDRKSNQIIIEQSFEDSPQQLFVPPGFSPVKINSSVNDAKYFQGGKFTYNGLEDISKTKKRVVDYRPDYVPLIKKTKSRKKSIKSIKLQDEKPDITTKNALSETSIKNQAEDDKIEDVLMSNTIKEEEIEEEIESEEESLDSDDDSSSDSSSEEDDSEDDINKAARTMKALSDAQDKFIQRLIKPLNSKRKAVTLDDITMDYDSPFAHAVSSGVVRLQNTKFHDRDDAVALDYLCQQAVMGGYPFSGGIESMSSNGIEASEGESLKVIVARRRNLLQKFNGDTIHIPSTPNDTDLVTQKFKNILIDIFSQQKKNISSLDDMCIDSLPLPASVSVKGPLNVQQYYDLSETNQAHSKYGKYQVKKRRPAEPNLDTLQPPNIVVSRQDDLIEGTSKLIMFWEKLRLEPYSSKKHINYFVLYPKNEHIENHVAQFFKGLSTLYETCQLGTHHPGNVGPYRKGLVPVSLLPARDKETFEERQIRSYSSVCESLGSEIGGELTENAHIVIYIINPISHFSSHLDLSRCFTKLMKSYHNMASGLGVHAADKSRARLVLQLMPIEHVLRSTSFGGCLQFGLKEIAFSVYSKCHTVANRQHSEIAQVKEKDTDHVTELYAPPFVLSKQGPDQIQFSLKNAHSDFPTILEDRAVLHMGYLFSLDNRWMIIVWTDSRGELVEFAVLNQNQYESLTMVFEEAWRRTKVISKLTGFTWTFVIAKMGLMFEEELKAWISFLPPEEKIAIVSLDTESTLHVNSSVDHLNHHDGTLSTEATTLGANTPNMMNPSSGMSASSSNKKMYFDCTGQTKALLLNHRVAHSNKRERMAFGILGLDSASTEDWMIPLASGYMIHTPPITENPNDELFNCNPLILEIHLVYNQTNHSAYSTLRDIIKKYHDLSFVNVMPSNNCFPIHLLLVERLSRILLVTNP